MRSKFSKIALAASFGIALAFTFSCTYGGNHSEPTYFYSIHGMKNCSYESLYETISSKYAADPSFEGKKNIWGYIRGLDSDFLGSNNGLPESSLRNELLQSAWSPTDLDELIEALKTRGNAILTWYVNNQRYCMEIWYLERE